MQFAAVIRVILVFLLLAACSSVAKAVSDTLPDSRGKDFWFCFPPNFHNEGIDNREVQVRDSLYVFVAAEKPTNVRIEYRDSAGTLYSKNFRINDPRQMLSFGEKFYPFELMGFNRCADQLDLTSGQNLRVAKQSFHVTSDEDVTVYAMSQALTTSDAFLVLPTDALGNSYYVMSYPADPSGTSSAETPSQFAIVATEDSTIVTINTDQPIYRYGRVPPGIRLNKGEVYLVQSQVRGVGRYVDLTGTLVESTKPIALFSGHQRATIPIEDGNRTSRDCLIEQMTPINTWGRGALVVPYPEPSDAEVFTGDRFRILAAYDSTEVYIDSVFTLTLNAGEFYEAELNRARAILATRAVMVAQFKHTSSVRQNGGSPNRLGDPFMMMIPPSSQFLTSYRFVNVQAAKTNAFGNIVPTYEEQWLTVVLPNSAIPTLKVDGAKPIVTYRPIPKSTYSYVHIPMSDGVHTVEADTGVGIYVYGYGIANSYGYVGGMAYKRYDFNAPRLGGRSLCYDYRGFVYDTALADTKVAKVVQLRDSIRNVRLNIENFIPPADSVAVTARLIDELQDGYFAIESRDIEGFVSRTRVDIPGYTLRILDTAGTVHVSKSEVGFAGRNRTYCEDYRFINTGRFDQTITELRMANPASFFTIQAPALPLTVKPSDTISFSVCYRFADEGLYSDTLIINVGCSPRSLMFFTVDAGDDTSAPRLSYTDDACRSRRTVLIREDARYQTGVKSVMLVDSTNCSVSFRFNAVRTNLSVAVTDPYKDAWYTLMVDDSTGNATMLRDTVEGFTIAFGSPDTAGVKRVRNVEYLGTTTDSVEIHNYGLFTKRYDALPLLQNQRFSIPQHQLPLVLKGGERRKMEIRYHVNAYPIVDTVWKDTLRLDFGCYTKNLELTGGIIPSELEAVTRCDVGVVTRPSVLKAFSVRGPVPNPAVDELVVALLTSSTQEFTLSLVDNVGTVVCASRVLAPRGETEAGLDVRSVPSGSYTLVIESSNDRAVMQCVVMH